MMWLRHCLPGTGASPGDGGEEKEAEAAPAELWFRGLVGGIPVVGVATHPFVSTPLSLEPRKTPSEAHPSCGDPAGARGQRNFQSIS